MVSEMKNQGLQNVRKEPVQVTHHCGIDRCFFCAESPNSTCLQVPVWRRGNESLLMTWPFRKQMAVLGLGGSINTTDAGIEATVLVVSSRAELKVCVGRLMSVVDCLTLLPHVKLFPQSLTGVASGKIIVFNVPFVSYGETVQYRVNGARWAAEVRHLVSRFRRD